MSSCAARMNYSFRNPFMIKVRNLFAKNEIFKNAVHTKDGI